MNISITKAEYIDNYLIKIYFNDEKVLTIDFANFLNNAKNPMSKKFIDKDLFKNFSIVNGDIIWNDYELCFPIWDLYINNIK